ncbi:YdcF family protein [Paenibacillus sp. CGMCC 1.16610]|uniref:YdcF family protein n=1 Tax=Paenibacillus anseongense TaxID=2682845 RepID=A0ABW9U8D7_9BACL|nr:MULTISPECIES: ElyC/SanA/YdcF family protein [Paenibacillus]MBA2937334.1 YdcF family protein [Paenibacillus sp. CGMCC 1.16610]MVQ36392.1 YdcF family protein [Paenibacillus anseongense]
MDLYKIADNINLISDFLGIRDIDTLTSDALEEKYKFSQADLLILFGGSIPYGCDVVGKAFSNNIAKNFMIVGGEGHTTESLRRAIHCVLPEIVTAGKMEADIMSEYMKRKYDIDNILIERNSTNCGNNVTYAFDVIKQNYLSLNNIIIVQDATMQCRMDAGFRKYLLDSKVEVINFASYKVKVAIKNEKLVIDPSDIWGMWDIERYISLLMGEIPRLLDDNNGYGPNGKNYIAHVDIHNDVLKAFEELKVEYGDLVRVANPLYASKTFE